MASYVSRALKTLAFGAMASATIAASGYAQTPTPTPTPTPAYAQTYQATPTPVRETRPSTETTPSPSPARPVYSWEPFGVQIPFNDPSQAIPVEGQIFDAILTDKDNHDTIYAISTADRYSNRSGIKGIDISYDNGATWEAVWDDALDGEAVNSVQWFSLQQAANGSLYSSHAHGVRQGYLSHTLCSTDKGLTWDEILDTGVLWFAMTNDKRTGYFRTYDQRTVRFSPEIRKINFDTNEIEVFATPDDDPIVGEGVAVFLDRDNNIFTGDNYGRKLYKIDGNTKRVLLIKEFDIPFINFIDSIVLGKKLFSKYDGDRNTISTTRDYVVFSDDMELPYPRGEEGNLIGATTERDNYFWLGTTSGHAFRTLDGLNFEYLGQMQSRWGPTDVRGLVHAGNGNVLGCDFDGLYRLLKDGQPYTGEPPNRVLEFTNAWQSTDEDVNFNPSYDFNNDGRINQTDLLALLERVTPEERAGLAGLVSTPVRDWKLY